MLITSVLAGLLGLTGALAAATAVGSARIERRHPPLGSFAEIDGLRIHYVDTAPGDRPEDPRPPVLFIHGASGNLDEPRAALGPHLPDRRTIYFDRPGHGHSARGPSTMASPAAQARIAARLLDRLGVDRAIVVGHSLGGSVAAAMAVLHPEKVAGLVFVSPATHPWPGGVTWYYTVSTLPVVGRLFAWTLALPFGSLAMEAAARGVFHPQPMPARYTELARVPLVLRPGNFLANAADVASLKTEVTALSPRYREIAAPTAIVTGDADGVVWPSIHSEGLKRDVPGAELTVLTGVGHMPHHTHPDAVVAAIDAVTARAAAHRAPARAAAGGQWA
jgi:pimeloyl-ACP methyl ester carboxylesterase